jgi:ATP adenylyltransferase
MAKTLGGQSGSGSLRDTPVLEDPVAARQAMGYVRIHQSLSGRAPTIRRPRARWPSRELSARPLLTPGTLWQQAAARSVAALSGGALQPIATEQAHLEAGGVRFFVRVLARLEAKERVARAGAGGVNPFLPPEEALRVADLTDSHVCLLNKFNVLDRHLLVVTRVFEDQALPLTAADFEALALCLAEGPALAFYNAGREAGASQTHRHLQLVPLPLAPEGPPVPIEPLLAGGEEGRATGLPFAHAFLRVGPGLVDDPGAAAGRLQQLYRAALARLGLDTPVDRAGRLAPYNLLVTRDWMLVVPRGRETWDGVSVNALGFAGALLVRDRAGLEAVRAAGPLAVLQAVATPPGAADRGGGSPGGADPGAGAPSGHAGLAAPALRV